MKKSDKRRKRNTIVLALAMAFFVFSGCSSNKDSSDPLPAASVSIKEDAAISYLGPEGTYTEEAAEFFFKSSGSFLPRKTVDEAIEDAASGASDYAVIPQENTIGGAVTNYVDALLKRNDVYVVGEVIIPINQTLMGIPGAKIEDIKTVYSHAQGIKQSEKWRKEHMPDAAVMEMDSTAAAAAYVAGQQDKSMAAVAAPGAAGLYGLEVLADNVQITDANKTRFYVLSKESVPGGTNAVFAVTCEAGRIDDIIVKIHDSGLELVTIHDRPEGSRLGKYNYIIEVEASGGIPDDQIKTISGIDDIRFLGSFSTVSK